MTVSPADLARVEELLGRPPGGAFEIVVRDETGDPVVLRNAPLLDDGRPMPTRYWLVGETARRDVGRLESEGGVRRSEAAVDPEALAAAHDRYAAERDAAIPVDHDGPRPSAGVGGTRRGVKCLHAHYAWHLAGGDDPIGRWVAEQLARSTPEEAPAMTTVAAIDCGTHSTRLLVHDGTHTVERLMTITKLGAGVDTTGHLAPDAIERTVEALRSYRAVMDRHGVEKVRITATSAARDAANRDEFFDAAEQAVGARPELLSGLEEGRLSFRGATAELDPADGPFLVFDIGGGSTEFAFGHEEATAAMSLDIGCVRLSEKYLESDPPRPEELVACLSITEAHLDDVGREMPQAFEARTFVGLAGTVAAAAMIEIGLPEYDRDQVHHFVLTKEAAEDVYRTVATEGRDARAHNPGLEPGRVDTIVAGMSILVRIMRYFGIDELLVSESDILDGLAHSMFDA
ncbi:MAG: DUF501 domain-containing protein [Actinomycetota bacterium]